MWGPEIHRRPIAPGEAVYLARECAVVAQAEERRGHTDTGAAYRDLGLRLVHLAEHGGDVVLLYLPGPPPDWQVAGDVPFVAGERPWRCPEDCGCRGLPLIPRRREVARVRVA